MCKAHIYVCKAFCVVTQSAVATFNTNNYNTVCVCGTFRRIHDSRSCVGHVVHIVIAIALGSNQARYFSNGGSLVR